MVELWSDLIGPPNVNYPEYYRDKYHRDVLD